MKAKDDKTLHCMLHWQHCNGFSDEMFLDVYKTKNDTEYLQKRKESPTKPEPVKTGKSNESIFDIAEIEGEIGIKEAYKIAFNGSKGDIKKMTNLVMFLNHRGWEKDEDGYTNYAKIYFDLYEKANEYVWTHFEKDDLSYYHSVVD